MHSVGGGKLWYRVSHEEKNGHKLGIQNKKTKKVVQNEKRMGSEVFE